MADPGNVYPSELLDFDTRISAARWASQSGYLDGGYQIRAFLMERLRGPVDTAKIAEGLHLTDTEGKFLPGVTVELRYGDGLLSVSTDPEVIKTPERLNWLAEDLCILSQIESCFSDGLAETA